MIDAKELRIGNIIGYREVDLNSGGEVIKYYPCTLNDISEIERGNVCNRYTHIPLTEDILLKCGFENADPVLFTNSDGDAFYLSDTNIEYLHQLQNLIYDLRGEELTVNL